MPGCVGYCVNYRLQRRLKTLRLFCLGICAYQKYRQFHFLDYLRLMARLHRFQLAAVITRCECD